MTGTWTESGVNGASQGVRVFNLTGLDDATIRRELPLLEVGAQIVNWRKSQDHNTSGGLFSRHRFLASDNVFDQIATSRAALLDDIVGGIADVSESLAFQKLGWEAQNPDDADVFNQVSRDVNLDDLIRQMWRELYAFSQVVVASWWGPRSYVVRGRTESGNRRKKTYNVLCPQAMTVLDSCKVVPVGTLMFGQERLAWMATEAEMAMYRPPVDASFPGRDLVPVGTVTPDDPLMARLFLGPYDPPPAEAEELEALGIDPKRLLAFDPRFVWRHTLTRPGYQRWADVRLASIFRLLDLKRQLMDADRVHLVGAANYILLVKKGDKDQPAQQPEIDNLKENINLVAKLPVIIGDHRISIEIITPKLDKTLENLRYGLIDSRLVMRCLGTFQIGTGQPLSSSGNVESTSRVVGRGLENRRWMVKRALEERIARAMMVANPDTFEDEPNLFFRPRSVSLDVDKAVVDAVLQLRSLGDLSRETLLEEFGFEQDVEAQRREQEQALDDIFQSAVPFSSPNANPLSSGQSPAQGVQGSQGGRPVTRARPTTPGGSS